MIWTTRQRSEGAGALSFFEAGGGPALMLIHGVGLRAEAWSGMVPFLQPRFRVICIDMPGHGQSAQAGARVLDDYVARFQAAVIALGEPVYLVGHSMGALLAVELAARLPDNVVGLTGLNTVYRRDATAAQAVRDRADALGSSRTTDPSPTLARWFGAAPEGALLQMAEACRGWLTQGDKAGYAAAYRIFAQHDGPPDETLARLTCPAQFLTGADDPNSTPAMSQDLAQRCAGHWQVLEGAAHMMPMTHAQRVSASIIEHASSMMPPRQTPLT